MFTKPKHNYKHAYRLEEAGTHIIVEETAAVMPCMHRQSYTYLHMHNYYIRQDGNGNNYIIEEASYCSCGIQPLTVALVVEYYIVLIPYVFA